MCTMQRPTKTTKRTAAACYAERHAECQDLLKRLATRLEQHKLDQASEPANWGYAGDLGRVTEDLTCILASLGDLSAARRIVDKTEF